MEGVRKRKGMGKWGKGFGGGGKEDGVWGGGWEENGAWGRWGRR